MTILRGGLGIPVVTKSHKRRELIKIYRPNRKDKESRHVYEVRLESKEYVLLTKDDFDFAEFVIKWAAIKRVAKASGWLTSC